MGLEVNLIYLLGQMNNLIRNWVLVKQGNQVNQVIN